MTTTQDLSTHLAYINQITDGIDVNHMEPQARWHFERRLGIGGSDVAAILGVSRYKTAYQLWLEKTNRAEPYDLSHQQHVHFGHMLEDVVAQEYTRRTGHAVEQPQKTFLCQQSPWLRANVDRTVLGENKILECKTANAFSAKTQWGDSGTDIIPDNYLLQVMHYMHVTHSPQADLAVLIGGNDFRIYPLEYNLALSEHVNQQLYHFWFQHVIADVPPEPVNLRDIEQLHPQDNGQVILASDEVLAALQTRQEATQLKKQADDIIQKQDMVIKQFMGEHQILLGDDGKRLASWKSQTSQRFNTSQFKKTHPELAREFSNSIENRVFRVA